MMVVSSGGSSSASRRNNNTIHGSDKKDLHHKDSNTITATAVAGDEEEGGAKYDKSRRRRRLLNRSGKRNKSSQLLVSICCLCVGGLLGGFVLVGLWATYSWITNALFAADPAYTRAMHKFEAAKRQLHHHPNQKHGGPPNNIHHRHPQDHRHNQHQHRAGGLFSTTDDDGGGSDKKLPTAVAHLSSPSGLDTMSESELEQLFDTLRPKDTSVPLHHADESILHSILAEWHARLDETLQHNRPGNGPRWIRPYLLPPLKLGQHELTPTPQREQDPPSFSKVNHHRQSKTNGQASNHENLWAWEQEWKSLQEQHGSSSTDHHAEDDVSAWGAPPVDYTNPQKYVYPLLLSEPPTTGGYPDMRPLKDLLDEWPQTRDNPNTIHETLLHFNYSDPHERAMAKRFRDARLPFKLYDIPEISEVTQKWTDDYVHQQFDANEQGRKDSMNPFRHHDASDKPMPAEGLCQESPDHFFAFYVPPLWQSAVFGPTPVRNNEWSFAQWAAHARYADATALDSDRPHFYWQAGVPKQERFQKPHQQSFISRDLNATLGATEDNFFVFNIAEQKGIQCRFGERGVTAATHYDGGQNMIAMLTGAKRYILSPPMACPDLGVFNSRDSPIFRHSLLNFAHLEYLNKDNNKNEDDSKSGMSAEERAWLTRAARAPAVETVLKQGEILFLPSFWFHYIVSVQKSAQCNVRSGIDKVGTTEFGSVRDINACGMVGSDPREAHGGHVDNF